MAVASRARVVVVFALVVLAGCGGGSGSAPATDVAVADATTTVAASSSTGVSTTIEVTTTGPTTTIVATTVPGQLGLSPDGPWHLVDSAPGVEGVGLVYELMPKLWVFLPTEGDLERGYLWTFNEEDRPIIEAYLMAVLTRYRSTDSVPATLDDPGWDLYYTPELKALVVPQYQAFSDRGIYADLDLGVVLRPRLTEDERSEDRAILLDCVSDGAVARTADGEYAPGATPGVVAHGYAFEMAKVDEAWKASGYNDEVSACSAG